MSAETAHGQHHDHGHDDGHAHVTRRGYLIGFLLSVVLTAIPFWMVMTHAIADPRLVATVLIGFAFLQILVHTVSFLHVTAQSESGWTLMAYVFTAVVVFIAIGGSLWIMHHLAGNMMPMTAAGMDSHL